MRIAYLGVVGALLPPMPAAAARPSAAAAAISAGRAAATTASPAAAMRAAGRRLNGPAMTVADDGRAVRSFIEEHNSVQHADALKQIVKRINDDDGVDWSVDELSAVRIIGVDEQGIAVEEVLCSIADQRCIAVPLHVRWPTTSACPLTAAEMRQGFAELSLRAFADHASDMLPPVYEAQQRQLAELQRGMNAQFGKLVKFYALRHAAEAFEPTEHLEKATLTQLTYEGLSLECETILLGDEKMGDQMQRRRWSASILFEAPCTSAEEVEDALVTMFAESDSPAHVDKARAKDARDDVACDPAPRKATATPLAEALTTTDSRSLIRIVEPAPPVGFVWGGTY